MATLRISTICLAVGLFTFSTRAFGQAVPYNGGLLGNFTSGKVLGSDYPSTQVVYWSNLVPFQADIQQFIPWLMGSGNIATINPYTFALQEYSNWTTAITYQTLSRNHFAYTDVNNLHLNKNGQLNLLLDDVQDIQGELKRLLELPNSPLAGPPAVYAVYLPVGTNVTGGKNGAVVSCQAPPAQTFCGYHDAFVEPNLPGKPVIPYMVIPACNIGGLCGNDAPNDPNLQNDMELATSHEISEVISDPVPFTGWVGNGEIADECNKESVFGNFHVASYWSNAQGKCIAPGIGIPNAPLRTYQQILTYAPAFGNTGFIDVFESNSDGYVDLQQSFPNQANFWTAIVPGHFGSGAGWTDLFFYSAPTGRIQFFSVNNTSGAFVPLGGGAPVFGPIGATNIVAGYFDPNGALPVGQKITGLFFYNRNDPLGNGNGTGKLFKVTPGNTQYYVTQFGPTKFDFPMPWDLVTSGEFDGQRCGQVGGGTDLVFYNNSAHPNMSFYTTQCQQQAAGLNLLGANLVAGVPNGLTAIASGYFVPTHPAQMWTVMGYNQATGNAYFWQNAGGGVFAAQEPTGLQNIGAGWTIVQSAELGWNNFQPLKADQPYTDLMFFAPFGRGILTTSDGAGHVFQQDALPQGALNDTIVVPLVGDLFGG